MPRNRKFIRGQLHIFIDNPMNYAPILPAELKGLKVYASYDDTNDALKRGDKLVCTMQVFFLSHLWIKAGYDIFLYVDGCTVIFDDEYVNMMGLNEWPVSYYYMQDLFRIGELYQTPI